MISCSLVNTHRGEAHSDPHTPYSCITSYLRSATEVQIWIGPSIQYHLSQMWNQSRSVFNFGVYYREAEGKR